MTVYGLLAAVVWAAVAILWLERVTRIAIEYLAYKLTHSAASIERDLHVAKLQCPATASATPALNDVQLPDDLDAYVNSWNDKWAREDERSAVRSKFLELHTGDTEETWQRVRRAVGIGELP